MGWKEPIIMRHEVLMLITGRIKKSNLNPRSSVKPSAEGLNPTD